MRGHIDKINPAGIHGWAFDPTDPSIPLQVRISLDDAVIATAVANEKRDDVGAVMSTTGRHGFRIKPPLLPKLDAKDTRLVKIHVRQPGQGAWTEIRKPPPAPTPQPSSTDDTEGISRAADRLRSLQLGALANRTNDENPLRDLSVLDLGCGDGFFCGEALRQGASRVVGIDNNSNHIEIAKERFPNATFINGSAWDIPDEQFDVIFLLSTIHDEPNPRALLQKIANYLTPNGTLIFECGVVHTPGKNWSVVQKGDSIRRYPNFTTLSKDLLRPYAWRHCGSSAPLDGDPASRAMLHCRHRKATALVITGVSRSGKTNLSFTLDGMGCAVVHTDGLLGSILEHSRYNWSPVTPIVRQFKKGPRMNFAAIGSAIISAGLAKQFVDLIIHEAPKDSDMFAIEGEILHHKAIYSYLIERLHAENIKTWTVAPA